MNVKMSDLQLVSELQAGNQGCFSELVDRYSTKAFNLAMRITRNQEDAEEILQDVFITVFKKIAMFEGKSAFSSWLYRITVNTAFMKLRKRKNQVQVSLEEVSPTVKNSWVANSAEGSDIDYMTTRHELRDALEQAIDRLPEEYRVIFVLRDVDGLSNQEVGDVLDLSVAAVKSRLHRSRLMLRKRLQRFYDEYATEPFKAERFTDESALFEAAA